MNNKKISSNIVTGVLSIVIGVGFMKAGSRYLLKGLYGVVENVEQIRKNS